MTVEAIRDVGAFNVDFTRMSQGSGLQDLKTSVGSGGGAFKDLEVKQIEGTNVQPSGLGNIIDLYA
jgi:hypothetical protein